MIRCHGRSAAVCGYLIRLAAAHAICGMSGHPVRLLLVQHTNYNGAVPVAVLEEPRSLVG